jgi:hypothetical protein
MTASNDSDMLHRRSWKSWKLHMTVHQKQYKVAAQLISRLDMFPSRVCPPAGEACVGYAVSAFFQNQMQHCESLCGNSMQFLSHERRVSVP